MRGPGKLFSAGASLRKQCGSPRTSSGLSELPWEQQGPGAGRGQAPLWASEPGKAQGTEGLVSLRAPSVVTTPLIPTTDRQDQSLGPPSSLPDLWPPVSSVAEPHCSAPTLTPQSACSPGPPHPGLTAAPGSPLPGPLCSHANLLIPPCSLHHTHPVVGAALLDLCLAHCVAHPSGPRAASSRKQVAKAAAAWGLSLLLLLLMPTGLSEVTAAALRLAFPRFPGASCGHRQCRSP